jgi:hypothetical protein
VARLQNSDVARQEHPPARASVRTCSTIVPRRRGRANIGSPLTSTGVDLGGFHAPVFATVRANRTTFETPAARQELFGGDALMFRTANGEPRRRDRIPPVTRRPRAEELKGVGTAAASSDEGVYLRENKLQEFTGFSGHGGVAAAL